MGRGKLDGTAGRFRGGVQRYVHGRAEDFRRQKKIRERGMMAGHRNGAEGLGERKKRFCESAMADDIELSWQHFPNADPAMMKSSAAWRSWFNLNVRLLFQRRDPCEAFAFQ